MLEVCPKCGSIFIEWDRQNKLFKCLQKSCLHTWGEMVLSKPVENIYLRVTLGPNNLYNIRRT